MSMGIVLKTGIQFDIYLNQANTTLCVLVETVSTKRGKHPYTAVCLNLDVLAFHTPLLLLMSRC